MSIAAVEQASQFPAGVLAELRSLLGDRVVMSRAIREQHSRGEGRPLSALPDVVVYPETNEEVAAIAKRCYDNYIPIIPFGTGTSLEGHVAALEGGVCIDLTRMNRVLSASPEALDCRVQAGVTRKQLNAEIRSLGLYFPVDPGADASLGGMAATRASGTTAVRYGTMRENVLGLTVITPDGRIVRTGGSARKSSAGLDLTRLYVGSEGTLGIITEIQLRLYGLPEAVTAAICGFPDLASAIATSTAVLQSGAPIARMEFLNAEQMRASIKYSKLEDLEEKPTLFFEFHGTAKAVEEQVELLQALSAEFGGGNFQFANRPEDRLKLWQARHDVYQSDLACVPNGVMVCTDACVPISELVPCILETEEDVAKSGVFAPIVGHVGDGNFHVNIVYDSGDDAQRVRAEELGHRVSLRAIRFGGTCSGEHGIGMHKIESLELEHGEAVEVMKTIKMALDPRGIMNPGKMLRLPDRARFAS